MAPNSIEHKPEFRALRSSVALTNPTVRALLLEELLNRALNGEFSEADPSVIRRVDASLAALPERLGPSAEAIAEVERRKTRFIETYNIIISENGGIRAELRGATLAGFLVEADQITRRAHQKPLIHDHELQSWIAGKHPAFTSNLSDSIEIARGKLCESQGQTALSFDARVADLMAGQAAYMIASGESFFQGHRAVGTDGVVDYLPFGLYLPRQSR